MKAVIFDLGNVLVAYDHQQTLAAVTAQCTGDAATVRTCYAAIGEDAGLGRLDIAQIHAALVECAGYTGTPAQFVKAFASGIRPDRAALSYAVALQARPGVTVAVVSNTNAAHVTWLDTHVPQLKELDLVIMSNEVGMLKPNPAIYRLALELIDVAPEDAVFVDDIRENVDAAIALGLSGIVHHDWTETRARLEAWLAP